MNNWNKWKKWMNSHYRGEGNLRDLLVDVDFMTLTSNEIWILVRKHQNIPATERSWKFPGSMNKLWRSVWTKTLLGGNGVLKKENSREHKHVFPGEAVWWSACNNIIIFQSLAHIKKCGFNRRGIWHEEWNRAKPPTPHAPAAYHTEVRG